MDQRPPFDTFGDSNVGDTFGSAAPIGDSFGQATGLEPAHGQGLFAPEDIAGPPVLWAGIAGAAALIGLALALLGSSAFGIAVAGWVIAGPVAIGLLAVYTAFDTKQQTKPFYSQPAWTAYCYWVTLAVALAGVIVGALRIAYWAGTR
ncbi:hypothetical protein [Antrihabitans stalactiti]|uniref:hypothetical protein n=1 Tax=Antrihabitans stalactiti TaxID=2584121 RepID=UPI00146E10BB|nr:hypothetical protein [Antrihabitans stalactiti]